MSYQNLLYAMDDRVATITLNRPDRHNALSVALVDEIVAAVAQADRDPEVRIVILACKRTSSSPIRSGTAPSPSSP